MRFHDFDQPTSADIDLETNPIPSENVSKANCPTASEVRTAVNYHELGRNNPEEQKLLTCCPLEINQKGNPVLTVAQSAASAEQTAAKSKDQDGNDVTTFTNDKEKRIKETRFYDKKHGDAFGETEYEGREDHLVKKTDFLNRTEKTFDHGGKLIEYERGDRRNPDPHVTKVYQSASGNYKSSEFEGRLDKVKSISEYKNRDDGLEQYTYREDGTAEARYKDGTIKKHSKNGETEEIKQNAEAKEETAKSKDQDGNDVTTFTNDKEKRIKETRFYDKKHGDALGETEYEGREDHLVKKTDFLNRTEKTFDHGGKLIEYERGDRRNPDPHLTKVYKSASGNYKSSEFEGRLDKVKSISEYKNRDDGLEQYTYREDGSGEYQYKDGTIKSQDRNGRVTFSKKKM